MFWRKLNSNFSYFSSKLNLFLQCFDNLWREVAGSVRRKVKAVPGDILKEEFGIPSHMRHVLEENVNVVIHLAGTVKFDEPLR